MTRPQLITANLILGRYSNISSQWVSDQRARRLLSDFSAPAIGSRVDIALKSSKIWAGARRVSAPGGEAGPFSFIMQFQWLGLAAIQAVAQVSSHGMMKAAGMLGFVEDRRCIRNYTPIAVDTLPPACHGADLARSARGGCPLSPRALCPYGPGVRTGWNLTKFSSIQTLQLERISPSQKKSEHLDLYRGSGGGPRKARQNLTEKSAVFSRFFKIIKWGRGCFYHLSSPQVVELQTLNRRESHVK